METHHWISINKEGATMKKSSVKKAIVILVMSLIVPMLLMGCSQKSESLRIGTSFSIVGGSPWSPFVNIGQNGLHQLIYDSLFVIDEHGFPIPGIVNDYEQKQLNYNLTIREGVLFHDGTELTAADVADTLLRLIKLHGNSNREAIKRFSKLEKIEVLGKYQLQFQLKEPDMFFLNTLTFGITPAYNPEHKEVKQWPVSFSTSGRELVFSLLSDDPEMNKVIDETYTRNQLIGSGPWKVLEKSLQIYNSTNSPVTFDLVVNKDYWKGAAKIENITFKKVETSRDSMNGHLLGKSIDLATPGPLHLSDLDRMQYYEKFKNAEHLTLVPYILDYPTQVIVFHDLDNSMTTEKVRKAIAYAINKEELIKVQNGFDGSNGQIANQYIKPNNEWYYGVDEPYEYNPEESKRLLREAGYTESISLKVRGFVVDDANWTQNPVANELVRQLKEVGIEVNWRPINSTEEFDFSFDLGIYSSPNRFYERMMSPERIYHPLYNDNTVFARAVEDMMRSTDLEIQKQKYHEALQELHDQAAVIPLIFEYYYYAYNNRIQGLELTNPNQIFVNLGQATLK